MSTRRHFLQTGPALLTAAGLAGAGQSVSSSDRIRVATIGFGGMGIGDTRYALAVPGVELAAVCGIHDGPLTRAREVHGDRIFTTRDYREVLARKDIDAVIVATPDHWHAALSIAAMEAGKDVYCEKPMVQSVVDGNAVIAAQERTGRIFQVGSQYVASAVYQKARELVQSGAIGRLTMVEAWLDRNTALGAWQYSIPPDSIGAFPKAVQEEFMRQYRQQYPAGGQPAAKIEPERFAPPSGYDAHQEHHRVFYQAVRSRKEPVEDAVFGFQAAGPALLANTSYFEKRMCHWDPEAMTVRQ